MKTNAILLLALIALMAFFGAAQIATPSAFTQKPLVPEFTLGYVDNSYDVAPTYGVDQYSGQTVITKGGYHVDTRQLEFKIKNQPFTAYEDENGNNISIHYNFRFKGPYGTEWSYYPDTQHTYGYYSGYSFPETSASNSEYTVITVDLGALTSYPSGTPGIPAGSEVEFQIQAIIGYVKVASTGMLAGAFYGFAGERSDWSSTKTVRIGEKTSDSVATPDTLTPDPLPPQNSTTSTDQSESSPLSSSERTGSENTSASGLDLTQITILAVLIVIAILLAVQIVAYVSRKSAEKKLEANRFRG